MIAWLPQASYPCGNFSDTSSLKLVNAKGSIGHTFIVCIGTENPNQVSFSPFGRQEISVLFELTIGHLRYCLTGMPPQPNSPSDRFFHKVQSSIRLTLWRRTDVRRPLHNGISKMTKQVVVLQCRFLSHLGYTPNAILQVGLESSSRGSSFPAVYSKPVPLAVGSLESR
jgi:hypothetical protein